MLSPSALVNLPDELVMLILSTAIATLDVAAIRLLAVLGATSKDFRHFAESLTAHGSAHALRAHHGVDSWEQLALALALKSCEQPDGGNRIGFMFASFDIATNAGSDVQGSIDRLDTYARIMRSHSRATAVVEAHCGPVRSCSASNCRAKASKHDECESRPIYVWRLQGAPGSIAHSYSLKRAELVVRELERRGVGSDRLDTVGHGKRVSSSSAVQRSTHPNARSAQAGFGWAEIFISLDGLEMPARPDFYPPRVASAGASCIDGVLRAAVRRQIDDDGESTRRRRMCVIC